MNTFKLNNLSLFLTQNHVSRLQGRRETTLIGGGWGVGGWVFIESPECAIATPLSLCSFKHE